MIPLFSKTLWSTIHLVSWHRTTSTYASLMLLATAFAVGLPLPKAVAQESRRPPQPGEAPTPPQAVQPGQPAQPGQPTPPGSTPAQPPNAEQNAAPPGPVTRPSTPPEPPDRKEFNIQPDEQGRVQFNFRNQPWPDLLRWLASASNMSLDWQQLPGDFVNLATTKPYSIEETRDLVNRLLLLRGYTMLEIDDVILVSKTEGINPALVPQVTPEQLESLPPNRFVRTSFALEFLLAEEIAEEIKDLKSNNGKITPLTTTNRLEVMDAVVVLRGIKNLLEEEQSANVRSQLAKEFPLKHVRASVAKEQLESFLGQKQNAAPNFSDPRQMQQFQQQMQQMQQQMMQQRGGDPNAQQPNKAKRSTDIYLVANDRQNSVIVHAPPNKMAIVESFIERIDVPSNSEENLQSMLNGVKVYRLSSLDPEQLVASLMAMDALEPTTRLEADTKNKSLVAYASLADQYTIAKVIEKLDGSAREFEVIQLRRLDAEEVAGTIRFLMGVEQEEEKQDNSYDYLYYYYGSRNRNDADEGKKDRFRVGANSRDNQLLVWANEKESEEINKLLIKLGEIPPEGGFASKTRVIEANRSQETLEYLKKLQERWQQYSDSPLVLPDETEFRSAIENPSKTEDTKQESPKQDDAPKSDSENDSEKSNEKDVSPEDKITAKSPTASHFVAAPGIDDQQTEEPPKPIERLTQRDELTPEELAEIDQQRPKNAETESTSQAQKSPPISIQFDENGNLVVRGDDPRALDMLEEMMLENPPPSRPFTVFQIKHTRASWIVINLKDYFSDEEEDDNRNRRVYYYYDREPQKKSDPQLSGKKKVKFVYDIDTNTVIVRNADDQQLRLIEDLIKLWDTPAKTQDDDLRYTQLVRVQYSKATSIVETIKDAYRDLLSSNDKAFQQRGGDGNGNSEEKRDNNTEVVRNGALNFAFNGKLSLGVDPVTNSVLVSAQGEELLKVIIKMVKELDEAAKPAGSMAVARLPGNANNESIQKALQALIGAPKQPGPQEGQQPNAPGAEGQPPGGNVPPPTRGQGRRGRGGD